MAKNNDNTLLWVAALGIGGYLLWKSTQPAANTTSTGVLATSNPASLALTVPPSSVTASNAPANASSFSASPSTAAMDTTGLVPATINQAGNVVLQPGQTIAVAANGSPVIGPGGIPLVFNGSAQFADPNSLAAQKWAGINTATNSALAGTRDMGECL